MENQSERKISEALTNMSVAEDLLIKAIGEFGNEKIQNALLKYQDRKKEYYVACLEENINWMKEASPPPTPNPHPMTNSQLANLIQDYFIALKTFYRERTPASSEILRNLEKQLQSWSAQNRQWTGKTEADKTQLDKPET
jgi:hypothetical protein